MNHKTSEPQLPYVSRNRVGSLTGTFSVATLDQKETLVYPLARTAT